MLAPNLQISHSVELLRSAIEEVTLTLNNVPRLLKEVIRENTWRDRIVRQTGKPVHFDYFIEFIKADPPEGLGTDIKRIQRLCSDDIEALDMIDRLLQRRRGSSKAGNHDIVKADLFEGGNSREYALRRLRNDRPDLHAKVLAKQLSPHKAMQIAGFRRKTFTVSYNPDEAARILVKRFSVRQLHQFLGAVREVLDCHVHEPTLAHLALTLESSVMAVANRLDDSTKPSLDHSHDCKREDFHPPDER